jgi:4-azaleucine resistance transporter AzlC
MSDTPAPLPASSATARLLRGVRLGMPVFLGYVPIAAAFGLAATSKGFSVLQSVACSAFVFAGAGQFIGLAALAGGSLAAALIATGVLNLRHLLFSATVAPHLADVPRRQQWMVAFMLTDEVFAVNIADAREGRADVYSMLGVGLIAWLGWVLGTAAGALAGGAIGNPENWGVGFAMPAMFIALLVGQLTGRREFVAGGVAAAAALLLATVLPGQWPVVAAAVLAATVMAVTER